jgi:hypothetical protein
MCPSGRGLSASQRDQGLRVCPCDPRLQTVSFFWGVSVIVLGRLPSLPYDWVSSDVFLGQGTLSYLPEASDVALNETWNALIYTTSSAQLYTGHVVIIYTKVWRWLPYQAPCIC